MKRDRLSKPQLDGLLIINLYHRHQKLISYTDRWMRSKGVILREGLEEMISPESVRDRWDSITHFDDFKKQRAAGNIPIVLKLLL